MKRIADLTPTDIRGGSVWRVVWGDWKPDDPLETVHVAPLGRVDEEDEIAYAALSVTEDGVVTPLVLIKEAGTPDYGGDYLEFVDGRWRQVGLEPNPDAPPQQEYVAHPLDEDPSFGGHEYREAHRVGFRQWATRLGNP
jgi:hypothetical protein